MPPARTPHKCEECKQQVRLFFTDHATSFGQIVCQDDYTAFLKNGLCSLCGNILADFAVMDTRNGAW